MDCYSGDKLVQESGARQKQNAFFLTELQGKFVIHMHNQFLKSSSPVSSIRSQGKTRIVVKKKCLDLTQTLGLGTACQINRQKYDQFWTMHPGAEISAQTSQTQNG
jgi:hypothetical protein